MHVENKFINKLLNDKKITQDEYNILFCSKEDWFVLNEDVQNWSHSKKDIIKFYSVLDILKKESIQSKVTDYRYIHFPPLDLRISSDKELIFYKSVFWGALNVNDSKTWKNIYFDKALFIEKVTFKDNIFNAYFSFKNAIFLKNVLFTRCEYNKSVTFSNVIFKSEFFLTFCVFNDNSYFKNTLFNNSVAFNEVEFKSKSFLNDSISNKKFSITHTSFQDISIFNKVSFNYLSIKHTDISNVSFIEIYGQKCSTRKKFLQEYLRVTKDYIRIAPTARPDATDYLIQNIKCIKNDIELIIQIHTQSILENNEMQNDSQLSIIEKINNLAQVSKSSITKYNISDKETARQIKSTFEKQNNITEANKYFAIEQDLYIDYLKNNKTEDKRYSTLISLYLNRLVSHHGTSWTSVLMWIITFSLIILFFHDGIPNTKEAIINIPNRAMELINPLNVFKKDYNLYKGHEFWAMLVRIITVYLFYQFAMAFRQNTRRK